MNKDFEGWNKHKQAVHTRPNRTSFKERDVWWCSLGTNIGDEQDGKGRFYSRPILVLKKFNRRIFIGLPLSTIIKDNHFYHQFDFKGKRQCVVLSQIRLLDAKRLENRMGELPLHEFQTIQNKLKELMF